MRKTMILVLIAVAGIAQAEQYPACHREKEIVADPKIVGHTREVWELQLVRCLDEAKEGQILAEKYAIEERKLAEKLRAEQDARDKERSAIEAKEKAELAKIEAKRAKEAAAFEAEEARRAKLPGVRLGMGAEQVIKMTSWGKPQKINRTINSWGTREQWVYGSGNYLYFENGVLTTIQN